MAETTVSGAPRSLRYTISSDERLKAEGEFVTYAINTLSPTPACTSFAKSASCGLLLVLVDAVSGVEISLPPAVSKVSALVAESSAAIAGASAGGRLLVPFAIMSSTVAELARSLHPHRTGAIA